MVTQICRSSFEPRQVLFEEPECRVTSVAKEATDRPEEMVVVDAQMLKEITLVTDALRRWTVLPGSATYGAAALLCIQESLEIL